jgi:hypothetical protein
MQRHLPFTIAGLGLLLALAGCGRGMWQYGERASWRHEAEVSCLKSGSVKVGSGVVQIQPIEGPGVCGADFPLKVTALGESATPMAYADDMRPPAGIPNASVPRWPVRGEAYAPPPLTPNGARMQWNTGPQGIAREPEPSAMPEQGAAPGAPMSIAPPDAEQADDVPDDAILPPQTERARPRQSTYQPEAQPPVRTVPPPLGPNRIAAATTPVAVNPPATLACPLVSALDRWVSEGVQPAALHWFGVPVTQIKQISAYSCREMVGSGTSSISEHAFGNALDVAGFTFADGRTISVVKGWHGTPEEQGFLHDVQLYACETFNTVLAPGYNAAHYNHIHVDLMRRDSGRRPCRPNAVPGEVVAAQARAHYASRRDPGVTGSVDSIGKMIAAAKAGEDGLDDDDADAPAPKQAPAQSKTGLFDFSSWRMFQKSSLEDTAGAKGPEGRPY